MSKTLEVLKAARVLVENKWVRGRYTDGTDGYDIMGAIIHAASKANVHCIDALLAAVAVLPPEYSDLVSFNDHCTDVEAALDLFDRAVDSL